MYLMDLLRIKTYRDKNNKWLCCKSERLLKDKAMILKASCCSQPANASTVEWFVWSTILSRCLWNTSRSKLVAELLPRNPSPCHSYTIFATTVTTHWTTHSAQQRHGIPQHWLACSTSTSHPNRIPAVPVVTATQGVAWRQWIHPSLDMDDTFPFRITLVRSLFLNPSSPMITLLSIQGYRSLPVVISQTDWFQNPAKPSFFTCSLTSTHTMEPSASSYIEWLRAMYSYKRSSWHLVHLSREPISSYIHYCTAFNNPSVSNNAGSTHVARPFLLVVYIRSAWQQYIITIGVSCCQYKDLR